MFDVSLYIKFVTLFLLIDSIWLVGYQKGHQDQIQSIQHSPLQMNYKAGLLFYALLAPLAFFYFIKPFSTSKKDAFIKGAVLFFLMYGTFDITNKAVFKEYKWDYALKDTLWGTIVGGTISYLLF